MRVNRVEHSSSIRKSVLLHMSRMNVALKANNWGYLPILSLVAAIGLYLLAIANTEARLGKSWAELLFWMGLSVLFIPITARLFTQSAARKERISLVILLGLGLYVLKLLHSPIIFTFHDEFAHWRTTSDIIGSCHLFNHNPLIATSAFYPGLEIVTAALVNLSGLTIFEAGVVVLGITRLLFSLTLYLFFEQVSGSEQVAGFASVIYIANPNFIFWGAQFSYESIALPLAMFTLLVMAYRTHLTDNKRVGLILASLFGVGAVVVSHHLTAYILAIFLSLWVVTPFLWSMTNRLMSRYKDRILIQRFYKLTERLVGSSTRLQIYLRQHSTLQSTGVRTLTILAVVLSLTWMLYIAIPTIGYLAPVFVNGFTELMHIITGETSGRQLFAGSVEIARAAWEPIVGFISVGLIILVLPLGLLQIWWRYRRDMLAIALALGAIAYPASMAFRFTKTGWEIASRATEFLFLGLAFTLAVGIIGLWRSRRLNSIWLIASIAWATIVFMGGMLTGWPSWARLPGTYLVAADSRSVELQGISAAEWVRNALGQGNLLAADRTNALLMGSIGNQQIARAGLDGVYPWALFFGRELNDTEMTRLRDGKVRYVVIDKRLSDSLPFLGVYFNIGEPDTYHHTTPIDLAALEKFDDMKSVSRIFDSGDIIIYDIGNLSSG